MRTLSDCSREWINKSFVLLFFVLAIELIFFKFIPDLGTATLPHQDPSVFGGFKAFENAFLTPGTVSYPRFAGTRILRWLAEVIARHLHSGDVRLHPLRIAAAILTSIYGILGLVPVLSRTSRYNWRTYAALYCGYCVLSLYVFYPYDMPSIALISIAAFLILEERPGTALFVMLLTGIFRESALHIVFFAFVWAICERGIPIARRMMWAIVYSAAFLAEYVAIRRILPAPVSVAAHGINLHEIFFGRGLWSLTCIVTVAILVIVPIHYLVTRGIRFSSDWRHNFFVVNCLATPAWIIFYRIMGGNISELRMLIPILIPIFYGLAIVPSKQLPAPYDGSDILPTSNHSDCGA